MINKRALMIHVGDASIRTEHPPVGILPVIRDNSEIKLLDKSYLYTC